MIIFFKLFLAHLLGDFLMQPFSWVLEKERLKARSPKLYYHVLIHGALTMLILFDLAAWPVALLIMITHFFIDWAKLSLQKYRSQALWFILDQLAHILLLIIAANWLKGLDLFEWFDWLPDFTFVALTGALFLTRPMAIIMMVILKPWSDKLPEYSRQSLESLGAVVGMLERLLVYGFILTGIWQAIIVLLVLKAIFMNIKIKRQDREKVRSYIIIGTVISISMAIVTALLILSIVWTSFFI